MLQTKILLVYHLKPKLTSNAVQIILSNTHMNVTYNKHSNFKGSAAANLNVCGKFSFLPVRFISECNK